MAAAPTRSVFELADALASSESLPVKRISRLLRNRRIKVEVAAHRAISIGLTDAALEIYRSVGRFDRISNILVSKKELDGAIDMYMDIGRPRSAMNLALKYVNNGKVFEIADAVAEKYTGYLDSSPSIVQLLMRASDTALLEQRALGIAGFLYASRNHESEKADMQERSIRYFELARTVGAAGIKRFKMFGDFYSSLKIAARLRDDDLAVELIKDGISHQKNTGFFNNGFMALAKQIIDRQREGSGSMLQEIKTELAGQTELMKIKRDGNTAPIKSARQILECQTVALT